MHLLKAMIGGAVALAHLAVGQSTLAFTNSSYEGIIAGQPVAITYSAPDVNDPAQIVLRKGDPTNLDTIEVLATDVHGGVYIWTPSVAIPSDSDYALQIIQGSQNNYTPLFAILPSTYSTVSSVPSIGSSANPGPTAYNTSLASVTAAPTGYVTINGTLCPIDTASTGTGYWPISGNSTFVSPTLSATSAETATSVVPTTADAETPSQSTDEPGQSTSTGGAEKVGGAFIAVAYGALGVLWALF